MFSIIHYLHVCNLPDSILFNFLIPIIQFEAANEYLHLPRVGSSYPGETDRDTREWSNYKAELTHQKYFLLLL